MGKDHVNYVILKIVIKYNVLFLIISLNSLGIKLFIGEIILWQIQSMLKI